MIDERFWLGRRVFITGHTGFKGSWLCLWLHSLGAKITGFALSPPTDPSLYELCGVEKLVHSVYGDVRDYESLRRVVSETAPEVVIHMAAKPIVRESYRNPVETYQTNVIGTVNLLEAVRGSKSVRAVVVITSDKCYENREWLWGYRESDNLGGYDPYSSSKACSELVTASYRNSFFNPGEYHIHGVALASARAGNVIGGGDWSPDRLVPDCVRALLKGEKIVLRNPDSIRPWQHVLEPLCGYLVLATRLYENGAPYAQAWNFGPADIDEKPVKWLVERLCSRWGRNASYKAEEGAQLHEAHYLRLDSSKARMELGWRPCWNLEKAVDSIAEWTLAYEQRQDVKTVCLKQIADYMRGPAEG
jgi:CDP-glucose 4,6-dehydratase